MDALGDIERPTLAGGRWEIGATESKKRGKRTREKRYKTKKMRGVLLAWLLTLITPYQPH